MMFPLFYLGAGRRAPCFSRVLWAIAFFGAGLLAAFGAASSARAAGDGPPETSALRACFDPDDLPFSKNSADGTADQGIYVELTQAIASHLNRPLVPVWYVMQFARHAVGEELLSGKCDLFFALPDRPGAMGKRVIFSRPILRGAYALVTPPGLAITHLSDLAGRKVAVQFSTPPQSLLAEHGGIETLTRMTPDDALAALAAGEADAAIIWGPSAGFLNHERTHDRFVVTPLANDGMTYAAAIGLDARNAALRDAVDRALDELGAVEAELAAKYHLPQAAPRLLSADAREMPPRRFAQPIPAPRSNDRLRVVLVDDTAQAAPVGNAQNGRDIINTYCSHCHGVDARAPVTRQNLHLLRERYGDQMDHVFLTTVHHGRPDKGMPNWSGVLTEKEFADVLAYLHETQDTP